MRQGKCKNNKVKLVVLLVLVGLICGFYVLMSGDGVDGSRIEAPVTADPHPTIEKNDGIISIPGYETLRLKANSVEQEIALKNPEQNDCYFVISLYLEDGTELYRSHLVEPGDNTGILMLNNPLPEGIYRNAVLQYECFEMDEALSVLNGASTKLTLIVSK